MLDKMISPSRTYVILIKPPLKETPEFKKFFLPLQFAPNDSEMATWYYLNRIDHTSMAYFCMSFEVYSSISDVKEN